MREIIETGSAALPVGPYSQAIRANGLVFVSGQIPIDPAMQTVIEGDVRVQTERALRNVELLLGAAGVSLADVVRCVVYLRNIDDFDAMNAVYSSFFRDAPPVRSTVAVSGLPRNALVQIEATAVA